MLYVKDKSEKNWGHLQDLETICYEDGSCERLRPHHVEIEFGKYKGHTLADVSDVWYLNFMKKLSTEKDLKFVAKCIEMRLNEMS